MNWFRKSTTFLSTLVLLNIATAQDINPENNLKPVCPGETPARFYQHPVVDTTHIWHFENQDPGILFNLIRRSVEPYTYIEDGKEITCNRWRETYSKGNSRKTIISDHQGTRMLYSPNVYIFSPIEYD